MAFSDSELKSLSRIFKALSDVSRLKIISELTQVEELCVSDIAERVGMSISSVSHHLRLLENLNFVSHDKVGKQVYHYVSDKCIIDIIRRAKKHVGGA